MILALIRALFKDLPTTESLRRFLYVINTIARREGTGLKFQQPLAADELRQRALTYHTNFALVIIYSQDRSSRPCCRSPRPAHARTHASIRRLE